MCGLRLLGDRAHSIRRMLKIDPYVASCMRTFPPFLLMFSINTKRAKTRENLHSHHKHDHHRSSTNRQNNHVVDAFGCQQRQLTTPLQPQKAHRRVANTIRHKAQKFQGKNPFSFSVIATRRHEVLTQSKSTLPRSRHSQFVGDRTLPPQQISPRAHRVDYIKHPREF
jgi:hypothetical protein